MPSDVPDLDVCERCASCGRMGLGRALCDGPFHCSHCWGEHEHNSPAAISAWWELDKAHHAWLERARFALPARVHCINDKAFEVVTDVTRQYFHGVGAQKVWAAAQRLCVLIDDRAAAGYKPGIAVELGAGVGIPGMLLAQYGWHIVLTDLPVLLPFVQLNVDANLSMFAGSERPTVAPLRFGCHADGANLPTRPDLCIGSDITYFDDDFEPLLETLLQLDPVEALLAIQNRNGCHDLFAAVARRHGWIVEQASCATVILGAASTRGYSCSRCTVLRLTRRSPRRGTPSPDAFAVAISSLLLVPTFDIDKLTRWSFVEDESAVTSTG